MVIINKSDTVKYSTVAHRALNPGQKSADLDMGDFRKALSDVIKSCGASCCLRLNDEERLLVSRLMQLDDEGTSYHCKSVPVPVQVRLIQEEEREKKAKMASIKAAREREAAILAETTYADRVDIDNAKARSANLKGDIQAKKLDRDATGTVSLSDLMGDNKFIENSMKHSNVPTAVASEEGWDMNRLNAPKVREEPASVPETTPEEKAPVVEEPQQAPEAVEEASEGAPDIPDTADMPAAGEGRVRRAGRRRNRK